MMILNEVKLYEKVNQPKDNSLLWRYMSLDKFINMISTRQLFFSRLDKFPDQLEGTMPIKNKAKIAADIKELPFTSHSEAIQYSDREEILVNSYRGFTLANCWSKYDAESLALWKIYLDGAKYGIAIQTSYDKLKKYVPSQTKDILFGEVEYVDELDSIQQQTISLRKIPPYAFENEVRAVIFNQFSEEGPRKGFPKYKYGLSVHVDIENLIEYIYMPPLSPKWYEETVSDVIQKYGYNFSLVPSEIKEKL
jgi:hypothetical protein